MEVFSLEDGRLVYALHPDELLNPASNTKIFTSAATLARLGSDYRFLTEFYVDDDPEKGVVAGNLWVRGRGDPTLVSERLWEIANELYHQGLREVKGDLIVDDTFFDNVYEGPGWDQDRSDRAYMAPISALSINWSSVGVYITPGEGPGDKARVELEPDSKYFKLDNRVVTATPSRRLRKPQTSGHMQRDGYHLTISGRVAESQPTLALWRRVGDPTLYAGETIKDLLQKRGIKVRGKVKRGVVQTSKVTLFYTAESDSLDIILKRLNKQSSNFVAEMLLKTLGAVSSGAPGSWASGVEAIGEFLQRDIGIRKGSYLMKNGSGLNDVNRFSAAQVVKVLAWIYPRMTLAPEFVSSLPIAGKDGTIRFRMGGTPASGRVRAKTGTLEDVTALSGFVESLAGRHYAFSVLVNDFPDTLHQAIQAEDAFAVALASYGAPAGPPLHPEPADGIPNPEDRLARYGSLAKARDPANAPFLRLAVQNERSQDLRAVAAEALYRSEPDEGEAIDALLEVLPKDSTSFEAQRRAGQRAGIPAILWEAFVDLSSDGDGRGLAGLLSLSTFSNQMPAEPQVTMPAPVPTTPPSVVPAPIDEPQEQPVDDRRTRAAGLVEVARQAPKELLDAMAQSPTLERNASRELLIFGFAAEPEAAATFAVQVADIAKSASPGPLQQFADDLTKLLPPKP